MKFAIIMNYNSYAGRDYLDHILRSDIPIDVISIGNFSEENKSEDQRCNSLWKPKRFDQLIAGVEHHNFKNLKDDELFEYLKKKKYDIGIQGGTGIINKEIIDKFKLGILNFHPGDLPKYRGCSAPEWQLFENAPVIATCHIIDEGIDTGKIYAKKILNVSRENYYSFRASVYPLISEFVVEVLKEIQDNNGFAHNLIEQNEKEACYRKYIGEEKISLIKKRLTQNKNLK